MHIPESHAQRGTWVELLFMSECARLDLKTSKPHGPERYDVLVDGPKGILRIQVKGISVFSHNRYIFKSSWANHRTRRGEQLYTRDEIDFYAVYVIPETAWYIIPVDAIKKGWTSFPRRFNMFRHPLGRYFEAWELLGVPVNLKASADPAFLTTPDVDEPLEYCHPLEPLFPLETASACSAVVPSYGLVIRAECDPTIHMVG